MSVGKEMQDYMKTLPWRDSLTRFAQMFLVSIDRSEVPTPYGAIRLLLKFRFRVEFFDFRVSRGELTLRVELGY
jgi:hypothetical protein